jgi:hypothetical protein
VVYSTYLKNDWDIILCSFWLLATDQSLSIWSSLPYSIFNHKKDELMPEPLTWNEVEKALNIMYEIIDWVEENNYHNCFAYHSSLTEAQKESFTFSLDYRATHLHPNIIFCCPEIKEYHFHRYQQEYDASTIFRPHRFKAQKKPSTREQFEILLENGGDDAKQWYVEHYNELKSFNIFNDESMIIVFAFDSRGYLKAIALNKTSRYR